MRVFKIGVFTVGVFTVGVPKGVPGSFQSSFRDMERSLERPSVERSILSLAPIVSFYQPRTSSQSNPVVS
jgi:hypothetical protein